MLRPVFYLHFYSKVSKMLTFCKIINKKSVILKRND